jgi:argininosuccinate lyase
VSANVEGKAATGFTGATELANIIVQKYHIAFRTSHKIVGALVKSLTDSNKTLLDATPTLLQAIAMATAGVNLSVKMEDIVDCTNPRKLVETYKVIGGPSAIEVEKAIKTNKKNMAEAKTSIVKLKNNLEDAQRNLNNVAESYVSNPMSTTENVRFKNSNL